MFLNAKGEGAVKVMVPTKSEKMAKLTPLARKLVGNISAVQAKDGASTHYSVRRLDFVETRSEARRTNLEDHDVKKHEQYACCVAGLVVGADVFPLKKSFRKQNTGQQAIAGH